MSRNRKLKLVYDVKSAPNGIDLGNIVKIMESHDVVLWDSAREGARPRIYGLDKEGQEEDLVLVDVAGQNIDVEAFTAKFEEQEKWDKELHRCQKSPVYYWTNYATSVYPHSQGELRNYLQSLELEDLSGIKDSDVAAEKWKAQKAKLAEAMKDITIEHLKEREGVVAALKENFESTIQALIEEIKDDVKIHDKKGNLLDEKKQVVNLVGRMKQMPVPVGYDNYRNKKMKWDHGMLIATPYHTLLKMFLEVRENATATSNI